jgi:hypothetical protein
VPACQPLEKWECCCRAEGHVWLILVVLCVSRRGIVAVINILDLWAAVATAIYSRFPQCGEMD